MGKKGMISCVKIVVDDIDRSAEFYKNVFGMHELFRMQDAITPELPIDEAMLSTADNENAQEMSLMLLKFLNKEAPRDTAVCLGFVVPDEKAAFESILQNGGTTIKEPEVNEMHGIICGVAADPDGCLLEIIQMLQ